MNRSRKISPIALSAAIALLLPTAACTAPRGTHYPSLLPRAIEKRSDAEPDAVPDTVKADPALDAQIAAFDKARSDAAGTLETTASRAERAVAAAKGAAAGSERWIDAQSALAELDGLRADASARLSDIEQLAITRGADGLPDYPPIETARAAAQEDLDTQAARIERLQAGLAPA